MFKTLQRLKFAYIAMSVALCATGVCLIIWPEQLKVLFCYLIGALALIFGIISIVIFFVRDIGMQRPGNGLMIGMLASIFGLILLLKPDNGAAFFSMLVGVFIIVDSIIKIQTSFELKNVGAKFWWVNLLISVASTVLGVLLVINPYGEGSTLLLIFIGISLVADSLANIFTAIFVWRIGKRIKKEESIVVVEE
jgi:uncharacterized membrane protein HdeD (DUF308 family)